MKKLLISDYDGTFNKTSKLVKMSENIDSVKDFMSNGNIFALASARSFISLKGQIQRYNIPYNYLICNNGGIVYDENDNVIFLHPTLNSVILKTIKYISKRKIFKSIIFKDYYGNVTTDLDKVYDIICVIDSNNIERLEEIKDELNYLCSTPFFHILIFNESIDKTDGIDVIISKEGIHDDDTYTVGNDFFDVNMLTRYNGYRMHNSNPALYKPSIKKVPSVRKLVRSIEKQ